MGLRWHIVQKKLPQSVKKRARWLWRAQKNLQGGALMCNSLRGLLSWQGGFLPGGFASVQSRRWAAVWGKFWLRRMGNEYFAIDRE